MTIGSFAYAPAKLSVKQGDTVVVRNDDLVPHTVTAGDRAFDSGEIAAGKTWRFVARRKGVFPYICTYHPTMKGILTVE